MQCSHTIYIANHLNAFMMAPLLLEEKHEETYEKAVEGIMVCIEWDSPNTTNLT